MDLRAYADLSRLSNAPTCVTNVLVGAALGTAGGERVPALALAVSMVGVLLLYVAGMALNDVLDASIDAGERPGRPIPSGRIARSSAALYAFACLIVGVALFAWCGWASLGWALALALTIVAYDVLHRRASGASILMGACRALVYLVSAVAIGTAVGRSPTEAIGPEGVIMAAALGLYITMITEVARDEARRDPATSAGPALASSVPTLALPVVVLAPAITMYATAGIWAWIAGLIAALWVLIVAVRLAQPPRFVPRAILGWLAGICLVDAFYLTLLDRPGWALLAVGAFALTRMGHRVILGT